MAQLTPPQLCSNHTRRRYCIMTHTMIAMELTECVKKGQRQKQEQNC